MLRSQASFRFQTLFLLALLPAVFLAGRPVHAATPDACAAAPEFSLPDEKLEHLAQAISGQDTIDVLAVGSGTMVGQDGGSGNAFPYRMIQGLRSELPGREISLTLRGSRGATAGEMLKLIETELAEQHFALVLWQTGTVEALRGVPPDELRKVLEAGIAKIRASGADLVLIDAQYTKPMAAKVNELPYLEVLRKVAEEQGVVLFRRYDLMQSWAGDGRNNLDNVRKTDREKVIDALHACLAQVLVKFVSQGAGIKAP
jgi:acyl-CoA thioesterase-1